MHIPNSIYLESTGPRSGSPWPKRNLMLRFVCSLTREKHTSRGPYIFIVSNLDYDGALRELQSARETLPNSPGVFELTGYIRRRQGYSEDSVQNLKRSLELDPRNIRTLYQIAISYYRTATLLRYNRSE